MTGAPENHLYGPGAPNQTSGTRRSSARPSAMSRMSVHAPRRPVEPMSSSQSGISQRDLVGILRSAFQKISVYQPRSNPDPRRAPTATIGPTAWTRTTWAPSSTAAVTAAAVPQSAPSGRHLAAPALLMKEIDLRDGPTTIGRPSAANRGEPSPEHAVTCARHALRIRDPDRVAAARAVPLPVSATSDAAP